MSRERRVAAALAAVKVHGGVGTRAEVLNDGANLVLRLEPDGLVARVAALTAVVRAGTVEATFALEVALGRYLEAAGAPVVPPATGPLAGPHRVDGELLSFWRHATPVVPAGEVPDAAALGNALRRLHEALRGYEGPVPPLAPLAESKRIMADLGVRGAIPPEQHAEFMAAIARWEPVFERLMRGPLQPLHGDPHRRNVVWTVEGPRFIDLEDAGSAPVGWDVACALGSHRVWGSPWIDAEAFLAAYGPVGDLDAWCAIRGLLALSWGAAFAEHDPEKRERMPERLAGFLAWEARSFG